MVCWNFLLGIFLRNVIVQSNQYRSLLHGLFIYCRDSNIINLQASLSLHIYSSICLCQQIIMLIYYICLSLIWVSPMIARHVVHTDDRCSRGLTVGSRLLELCQAGWLTGEWGEAHAASSQDDSQHGGGVLKQHHVGAGVPTLHNCKQHRGTTSFTTTESGRLRLRW